MYNLDDVSNGIKMFILDFVLNFVEKNHDSNIPEGKCLLPLQGKISLQLPFFIKNRKKHFQKL